MGTVGIVKSIFDAFVESVKIQDKVNHISSDLERLKIDVRSIDGRLIKVETLIEFNEKQQPILHRFIPVE